MTGVCGVVTLRRCAASDRRRVVSRGHRHSNELQRYCAVITADIPKALNHILACGGCFHSRLNPLKGHPLPRLMPAAFA
jgi:hypothetical protein